jgi:dTDP-4-dehydrorhamnose 3,5-epimerase
MIFTETKLKKSFIVDIKPRKDGCGFFARSWCPEEFMNHGLNLHLSQCNISFNKNRGTLRGMHYQVAPFTEAKLVRCTMIAIHEFIFDLRPDSDSCKQWLSVEMTKENRLARYFPEGLAHGFQTLADDTEVFYQISEFYQPECARGIRWDGLPFSAYWPIDKLITSENDKAYPMWGVA